MKIVTLYIIFFASVILAQNLSITPDTQSIGISQNTEIKLTAGGFASLRAYSVTVKYNPLIAKCMGVTKSAFLSANYSTFFYYSIDTIAGTISIDEAILGTGFVSGGGDIAVIKFSGVQNGYSLLNISHKDFRDSNNVNISVTAYDGRINVGNASPVLEQITEGTEFYLIKNYPNPFNPSTNIVFTLPKDQYVNISVYNIVGQIVAVLKNENVKKGSHIVTWDGKGCSSGVYISVLRTMESTVKTKMILQK